MVLKSGRILRIMRRYKVLCEIIQGEEKSRLNFMGMANEVLDEDRLRGAISRRVKDINPPYLVSIVRVYDGKILKKEYTDWQF